MEISYKIIGGDGREYGPVTLHEIKAWIRDGRVGRQTQVSRSDLGSWLAASQYQEFQPEIGSVKATSPDVFGDEMESVGFWPRLGALIIDSIIIYFAFVAVAKMLGWSINIFTPPGTMPGVTPGVAPTLNDLMPMIMIAAKQAGVIFLIRMIYEVLMNGRFGATLGKMIIGAKIVRLDGSRLGYLFALFRFLAMFVMNLICYLGYIIAGFMIAFREDKRGLHDLIVGTRVIYKR
jgi:uncharacterized RDD family membrane protein YckC